METCCHQFRISRSQLANNYYFFLFLFTFRGDYRLCVPICEGFKRMLEIPKAEHGFMIRKETIKSSTSHCFQNSLV